MQSQTRMREQKGNKRTFRDNKLINLAEHEMRTIYRFGIESVNYLLDLLGDDLRRGTRKKLALSVEEQLLIALHFYTSGQFLPTSGDWWHPWIWQGYSIESCAASKGKEVVLLAINYHICSSATYRFLVRIERDHML